MLALIVLGVATQRVFIQSADPANPVLLFLHGGPGMPEFFLAQAYPTKLERDFTVVWWEQRGAGVSYDPSQPLVTLTVDQLIADTVAVADYLRDRFGQDKIYLLGHSWGSFLGIKVAAAAPDRFAAYVGMAQVAHQLRSELLSHAYMLDAFRARDDSAMVRKLEAAPVSLEDGMSDAFLRLRDSARHRVGSGTTRDMASVITGVFLPVWRCPAYTLGEKVNLWRGKVASRRALWTEFLETDLTTQVTSFELPVYFFVGAYDYTANKDLALDFFARISAPVKGFYLFRQSAHSPLFEEPDRAREILLRDVLGQTNTLADQT